MTSQRWDISQSQARLQELAALLDGLSQKKLLVLSHNNPDPDTLAGAFGFSYLLQKKFNIRSVMGYGGVLTRAENKAMVSRLRIPTTKIRIEDLSQYHSIALIDGQPLTGNNLIVSRSQLPSIVIDHHPLRKSSLKSEFHDVRPDYGATSSIITEYFMAAELTPSRPVASALLYGIKTDTNSLIRSCCKADQHAFNYLSTLSNPRVLAGIEKPSLPIKYFRDFLKGLANTLIFRDVACCIVARVETDSIIPELADLLMRIEGVTWSFCMGEFEEMMLLSLRSRSRTQGAETIIRRLVGKKGASGGHNEMAGGQIHLTSLTNQQKSELPSKLIAKLLKLLKRENANPRPLTSND